MNKKEIIILLDKEYGEFIKYIKGLSDGDYLFQPEEKWSAQQQLEHIVMCIKPLVQVFSLPQQIIDEKFGKTNRPSTSYPELLSEYAEKLATGGKAPLQYVPEKESKIKRNELLESLRLLINELMIKVDIFEEEDLETSLIPHPLLGKITLKEMLYNAIYHVEHHKNETIKNLNKNIEL